MVVITSRNNADYYFIFIIINPNNFFVRKFVSMSTAARLPGSLFGKSSSSWIETGGVFSVKTTKEVFSTYLVFVSARWPLYPCKYISYGVRCLFHGFGRIVGLEIQNPLDV